MPRISIIVPIYNAAATLPACLDALAAQTHEELEILLVDNNSTDESHVLCEKFCETDKRFHLLHQPRQGVAAARNAGLDAATGAYIGFVDSDDCPRPTMFADLLAALESPSPEGGKNEIAICNYVFCETDGWQHDAPLCPVQGQLTRHQAIFYMLQGGCYDGFLWNKLFAARLFRERRLDESIFYCEDLLAVTETMLAAEQIVYLPEVLYEYRLRADSAIATFSPRRLTELDVRQKIIDLLAPVDAPLAAYARAGYAAAAVYHLRAAVAAGDAQSAAALRKAAKTYWPDLLHSPRMTGREKVKAWVSRYFPALSDKIWKAAKRRLHLSYNKPTGQEERL